MIIFFIFFIPFSLYAQDYQKQEKEFISFFQSLEPAKDSEFIQKFHDKFEQIDNFVKKRSHECLGEVYHTITLEDGVEQLIKRKLSAEEIKDCNQAVINFRLKLLAIGYDLRKKYLKQTVKSQLNELDELKKKELNELKNKELKAP